MATDIAKMMETAARLTGGAAEFRVTEQRIDGTRSGFLRIFYQGGSRLPLRLRLPKGATAHDAVKAAWVAFASAEPRMTVSEYMDAGYKLWDYTSRLKGAWENEENGK